MRLLAYCMQVEYPWFRKVRSEMYGIDVRHVFHEIRRTNIVQVKVHTRLTVAPTYLADVHMLSPHCRSCAGAYGIWGWVSARTCLFYVLGKADRSSREPRGEPYI